MRNRLQLISNFGDGDGDGGKADDERKTTREIWRLNRGEAKGARAENLAREFESSA